MYVSTFGLKLRIDSLSSWSLIISMFSISWLSLVFLKDANLLILCVQGLPYYAEIVCRTYRLQWAMKTTIYLKYFFLYFGFERKAKKKSDLRSCSFFFIWPKHHLLLIFWQIPILGNLNMVLNAFFLIGFSKSLISFCHIFVTGGSGKNGSTVAVSHLHI